jgi:hypothetical protein
LKRFMILAFVALFGVSCGSKNSPTGAGSGSFSWNGPLVISAIESGLAFTEIATSSGPVNNAAVTLSYSGTAVPLAYIYAASSAVTYSGGVTLMSLAYYDTTSFTYTAGQPYTITASFGGNSYSAGTTAVGALVFSTSGSNLVCAWVGGGDENVITAEENVSPYTVKTFGPNVTSPYSISNSSLPGATGQNDVTASINNLNNSAFAGTTNGSYLLAASEGSTFNY